MGTTTKVTFLNGTNFEKGWKDTEESIFQLWGLFYVLKRFLVDNTVNCDKIIISLNGTNFEKGWKDTEESIFQLWGLFYVLKRFLVDIDAFCEAKNFLFTNKMFTWYIITRDLLI